MRQHNITEETYPAPERIHSLP